MGAPSSARLIEHTRVRELNDRIRAVAESNGVARPIRFICECGDAECRQTIELELDEFEAIRWREHIYLVASGHVRTDRDRVVEEHEAFTLVTVRAGAHARGGKV